MEKPSNLINVALNSFNWFDRLKLRYNRGIEIPDTDNIPELIRAVNENGFGFIRGRLPKRCAYPSTDDKYSAALSRNVMFYVCSDGEGFQLRQTPGMHVVTGTGDHSEWMDPCNNFLNILQYSFQGSGTVNTYLLGSNYEEGVKKYGYEGNSDGSKVVCSQRPEVYGDRYKFLFWRCFSSNYLPTTRKSIGIVSYGSGTVLRVPEKKLEAYVFLAEGADEKARMQYYSDRINSIKVTRDKPIKFLNVQLDVIGQIN